MADATDYCKDHNCECPCDCPCTLSGINLPSPVCDCATDYCNNGEVKTTWCHNVICNTTGAGVTCACAPSGATTSTRGKDNVGRGSSAPPGTTTSTYGNDHGGSGSRQGGYFPREAPRNMYSAREVPDPEEQQAALEEASGDE